MLKMSLKLSVLASILFIAAACEDISKAELLAKVEGKSTPAEIEAALGKPADITNDGALKLWKYNTSDGPVCFSMVGNLAMRMICS
ncbi:hypothetical protein GUA87_14800 [Sneathiella sp. P13V-1]|uniref:hypothetical protein n=1 Tax=Sneathiella sp. P13V-1 TaxID=2697366 RepID=UPI00187B362C|nr:hypothetical protein [Sneathiella sp. P13V-1]MBE7638124.1 hypothetical protein [Sneathiella sp. P13V-1]